MTNRKFKQSMVHDNDVARFVEKAVIANMEIGLNTAADACSKVKEQVKL